MSSTAPDPRLNPYRDDLAAASLKGTVASARFVEGKPAQVSAPSAPLRREPRPDAPLDSEALYGELVTVFEENDGWAWVQLQRDSYVGYLPAAALTGEHRKVTHRVRALRTYIYPEPDIKSPPRAMLSLTAGLAVSGEKEGFLALADGGFVFTQHAAPLDKCESDFVGVAERFVGTPYLWGGRTSIGLDCSALVQLSLEACGLGCPRDSSMQESVLGEAGDPAERGAYRRGDLLYWPGHVAIVRDSETLLHSTAHVMATLTEPLQPALDRIAGVAGPVRSLRRLP